MITKLIWTQTQLRARIQKSNKEQLIELTTSVFGSQIFGLKQDTNYFYNQTIEITNHNELEFN